MSVILGTPREAMKLRNLRRRRHQYHSKLRNLSANIQHVWVSHQILLRNGRQPDITPFSFISEENFTGCRTVISKNGQRSKGLAS